MKKSILLACISAIACAGPALHSCTADTEDSAISFKKYTASQNFILEGSASDYELESDLVYQDSVYLVMPVSLYGQDLSALRDTILVNAFGTTGSDIMTIARGTFGKDAEDQGFKAVPTDTVVEMPNGFTYTTVSVQGLDKKFLTCSIVKEIYAPGAAHGFADTHYITYDIGSARVLTLNDIFTTEGLGRLPAVIADRASELTEAIGPTNVESLPAGGNFYINQGEIVFAYQPYEIASYAQGAINIPIDTYRLAAFMSPEGLDLFGFPAE